MFRPTVSVILVNYNGFRHLDACLRSLMQQDYPAELLEVVLIDNGSSDESIPFIEKNYPKVRLIRNAQNVGFSPAVNQGAREAKGEYIALMNNDAYAAPNWISELVKVLERRKDQGGVCIASRMLDWYGKRVDFDGGGVSFYGYGVQLHYNLPADRVKAAERKLLFACGGAMLIERAVFLKVGGFDEQFFAYFEDVDFGWRLWIAGYEVWFAPEAVVYHRHHGTSGGSRPHQVYALLQRNALATIIKNYDEEHLKQVLPAALMLLNKKSLLSSADTIDRKEFDLKSGKKGEVPETANVPLPTLSYLVAAGDLLDDLPGLMQRRAEVQAMRRRPESEILPLFHHPYGKIFFGMDYALLQEQLVDAFKIHEMFEDMRPVRVLFMCGDPLRKNLAGTGMRALEMAKVLSKHCQVMLVAPEEISINEPLIDTCVLNYHEHELLNELLKECDVVIAQGLALEHFPALRLIDHVLVLDVYTPFVLENLAQSANAPREQANIHYDMSIRAINNQLAAGDFFICASERQRDFWMGALMAQKRINPDTYNSDPSLRNFLEIVPFGVSSTPPQHTNKVLKGVYPGINEDDTVLLWNGGIWEWFDPITLLHAMAKVREQRPNVKLFFMGKGHPNTAGVPHMPIADRTFALAEELGLMNKTVFFNEGWVAYDQRQNYLIEADIGVSLHFDTAETRLSFRTRLLDCIWAGLPLIVSSGDTLSDLVKELNLGRVLEPEDVDGWAAAIIEMADIKGGRASFAPAFAKAQELLSWERNMEPLIRFCKQPRLAADAMKQRKILHAIAQGLGTPEQQDMLKYIRSLEEQIEKKNAHIEWIEGILNQMQNGRLMKLLRRFGRA